MLRVSGRRQWGPVSGERRDQQGRKGRDDPMKDRIRAVELAPTLWPFLAVKCSNTLPSPHLTGRALLLLACPIHSKRRRRHRKYHHWPLPHCSTQPQPGCERGCP